MERTDKEIVNSNGNNHIILDVNNVSQWFDDNRVLYDINLQVVQGQFVAMVGPSGCGKSTLLRAILGTVPPKEGSVETDGYKVQGPNRHVGIVYQRYGLYQFLTAQENVAFGLMLDQTQPWTRIRLWDWLPLRKRHLEEARELLVRFKLEKALKCYPSQLSGGMQQRVAIAQALIMKPKLLLLDEPFGALDEATREDLQDMLLRLYEENLVTKKAGGSPPWTVILVTHELNEAFYVSDRVIGLSRNWKQGKLLGPNLGATKIWDKCAPVYHPGQPRNYESFADAKAELRKAVFDKDLEEREEHVSFWEDLKRGVGTGVAIV
jgi:NitT/TauT family transport system ATP-binding protein